MIPINAVSTSNAHPAKQVLNALSVVDVAVSHLSERL